MNLNMNNIESTLFDYLDQIKVLLAPETWQNILLNCSKNEILLLLLLYRNADVNMTKIAEYLNVPLNTATGIVDRMEKKGIILRLRSAEDKRVMKIILSDSGKKQLMEILQTFIGYGQRVMASLTMEEINVLEKVIKQVIAVLQEVKTKEELPVNQVRKIIIE